MKIAILFRGFHYYENKNIVRGAHITRQRTFDYRDCFQNIKNNIIIPLRKNHEVDIYLVTYHSPIEQQLGNNFKYIKFVPFSNTQKQTLIAGLEFVKNVKYDRVIVLRLDLVYKKPIIKWNIPFEKNTVYLPWREYKHLWNKQRRTGDTIFIVDSCLGEFIHVLKQINNTHVIYNKLKMNVKFICNGFYDSNTTHKSAMSNNPIYRMYGRPYHFF